MWHVANWVKGNVLVCMFGLACSRRLVVLLVVGFVFVCVCVCVRSSCRYYFFTHVMRALLKVGWWWCWFVVGGGVGGGRFTAACSYVSLWP